MIPLSTVGTLGTLSCAILHPDTLTLEERDAAVKAHNRMKAYYGMMDKKVQARLHVLTNPKWALMATGTLLVEGTLCSYLLETFYGY